MVYTGNARRANRREEAQKKKAGRSMRRKTKTTRTSKTMEGTMAKTNRDTNGWCKAVEPMLTAMTAVAQWSVRWMTE